MVVPAPRQPSKLPSMDKPVMDVGPVPMPPPVLAGRAPVQAGIPIFKGLLWGHSTPTFHPHFGHVSLLSTQAEQGAHLVWQQQLCGFGYDSGVPHSGQGEPSSGLGFISGVVIRLF